ncbi:MAG TPA: FAD-dependent oxidoreductase [Gaiellales bacterium]
MQSPNGSTSPLADLEERYRARSLWLDGVPAPLAPRPSLPGDVDCDVAIVGAGFTGLWTAYHLARNAPDMRIVVVEREIAGFGPSGRNGGWVSGGLVGSAGSYERTHGRDGVVRAIRETHAAVDHVAEVVEREGIDCGFLKRGSLFTATSEPQRQRLLAGHRELEELGIGPEDARLLAGAESNAIVRVEGCLQATFTPHAARVDPGRLARGLADACERLGVTIHERTAATAIAPGRVSTPLGTVSAGIVLQATEAYSVQLPHQRLRYLPLYSLMIATEPLPDHVWDELGWTDGVLVSDSRYLFFYAQRTADGRIALGGRGAPYQLRNPIDEANERNAEVRGRLERAIQRHFPAAARAAITHHWGGPLGVPRDWSMAIHFDRAQGLGWAGGYAGHGVVAANISGRTLADLVLGRDTDLVHLPWVGHRSRRWEPEPLRFVASRAIVRVLGSADRAEDATGRRARRTRLLAPVLPPH